MSSKLKELPQSDQNIQKIDLLLVPAKKVSLCPHQYQNAKSLQLILQLLSLMSPVLKELPQSDQKKYASKCFN